MEIDAIILKEIHFKTGIYIKHSAFQYVLLGFYLDVEYV